MGLKAKLSRALRPAFSWVKDQGRRLWRCGRRRRYLCWAKRLALVMLSGTLIPVLVWRWLPPPASAVMIQRAVGEWAWVDYRWVPMEAIAPEAALAVVAAEDQKFPQHPGFDVDAIRAALHHNNKGGSLRGASTISQQVAKNLFLWEGRSWLRKGLEAWFTGWLELLWPKERILEVYLNIAEMGDRTFGVEAAARRFYGRSAGELTATQAATLAAVLPNPRYYRVDAPSAGVRKRRDWVLRQMRQLGGADYLSDVIGAKGDGSR